MGKGAWLGDRDRSRPTETKSDRDRPRPIETDRDRKPETLHIPTRLKDVCEDPAQRHEMQLQVQRCFNALTLDKERQFLTARNKRAGTTKDSVTDACVRTRMSEIESGIGVGDVLAISTWV